MIFGKKKADDCFKFSALEVYAWDRVVGGKKKFRTVFDSNELTYLSVKLSIFNKQFDEADWNCELKLIANRIHEDDSRTEICSKVDTVEIAKTENIFDYDYGWGEDERGKYWKEGKYEWKAFIDDKQIGSTKFYIESVGRVNPNSNPYLKVISLKTYEAPDGDIDEDKRLYLKVFDASKTRYLMGELKFINLLDYEWHCEIFFNIYDDTGMLIGNPKSFCLVTPERGAGEDFTITAGWGSDNANTWIEDDYTMEVIFMDTLIAKIPFKIGTENIPRLSDYEALLNDESDDELLDNTKLDNTQNEEKSSDKNDSTTDETTKTNTPDTKTTLYVDDRPVEEILAELDALIGMQNVKDKIHEYINYVSYIQLREEQGIKEEEVKLHSVFTGNPGTGKTTVIKLLGKIFKSMGLLSKGEVHIVEANDLISGFVRQTGKDTKDIIEKARGGILFIDEAYMLFRDGTTNDFGPEAIAALITEMSDGKGDIAIFMAGYPAEMEKLLDSNPGLRSRIKNYYHFNDYTPDELLKIAELAADKKNVELSKEAKEEMEKVLTAAYRRRDRNFGNARFAFSLIEEAKINLGVRLMKSSQKEKFTKKQLSLIKIEDVEDVSKASQNFIELKIGIDENLLNEALAEINSLVGLNNIKQEIRQLIKLTRYYHENKRDVLKAFSMHTVFSGNPGTGKTTVARIMAKVYKALGILERGHLKEVDGGDLIAGFVGQTSDKTKQLVDEAMGGILFIDEAYSITEGTGQNSFGKEAISALLKLMEDNRGEFGVIVAGYTKNMADFLKANPGLNSRFDQHFEFKDFSVDELMEICIEMFENKQLKPSKEAEIHLKEYISYLHNGRDQYFGNARSVRKIVEKVVRNQELRMADLKKSQRTKKVMSTISIDDVKEFVIGEKSGPQRRPLGFKIS